MPCLGMVGTFVRDLIRPRLPCDDIVDWGGLMYSLASFDVARADDWTFLPIANVGADVFDDLCARVEMFDGLESLAGLRRVPEPNNRVELAYHSTGERSERLEGGVPTISQAHLTESLAACDALYVNFIAGWELDLAAARAIRRSFSGPIYCDIHSLLLGVSDSGMRVRRELPDWPEWAECFDWIQGNRPEIRIVSERADPADGVAALVAAGADGAFCTLDESGAAWATASAPDGAYEPLGPDALRPVVDPTGCGDVWGAANVAGLVAGRVPPATVRRANRFAATSAAHRGTSGLARVLARETIGGSVR